MSQTPSRTRLIVGGIILFLFLLYLIFVLPSDLFFGYKSRTWPTISGTVTRSSVVSHSSGRNGGMKEVPSVSYSYNVGGQLYQSDRLSYNHQALSFVSRIDAERYIDTSLKPGMSVLVHYDPSSPARSVLIPGIDWMFIVAPLILIVFFGVIIFAMVFDKKKKRQAQLISSFSKH